MEPSVEHPKEKLFSKHPHITYLRARPSKFDIHISTQMCEAFQDKTTEKTFGRQETVT